VLRAKIVLLAARGMPNAKIAARLGITVATARKWRGRFATHGLDGLDGLAAGGAPVLLHPVQVAEVKALACQLPAEQGVPLSGWSCPELARETISRGITTAISASTVAAGWPKTRSSPGSTAPGSSSATRLCRQRQPVLDLYARRWQDQPLGPDEYVLCADDKTSIQAPCRCHPPCQRARPA
jgi:transposase